MKRLLLTIAAVASVAGPMAAVATDASAQGRGHNEDRWDRRDDRRGDRHSRWDDRRYNGYYYRDRWYYGAPPAHYYGRPDYRPGYSAWRRGGYLPPYYRGGGYVVHDYGRYHLRQPPRGYYWYRAGNDYVLAAIATGLIFEIINN
jgi:Ni/Co efflux regulator RcnB